jgi:hypothetical protein
MKKIVSIIVGLLIVNLSFGQTQNKKSLDKSLMIQLDTIHKLDQHYRQQMSEIEKKYGAQSEEFITNVLQTNKTDSLNLIEVEKILAERGWLGADVIGEQGNKTLFLVIQHSDLETQLKYLPMMREAVQLGNARKIDFALFEDRTAMRQGKRQIYGSQISKNYDTGEVYVCPLIEPEKVNERRAEVGLGAIEEYVKNFGIIWDVEKHKAKTKSIESKKEK